MQRSLRPLLRAAALPLVLLAAPSVLAGLSEAQTLRAEAGKPFSPNEVVEGPFPAFASWNASGPTITLKSWAWTDLGVSQVYAKSGHWDSATFETKATGGSVWELNDVVFSSAGSGSITVGLNLTISGVQSHIGTSYGVQLVLQGTGGPIGSAQEQGDGTFLATGKLVGWNMVDVISIKHSLTVPLNTPVTIRLDTKLNANTGLTGYWQEGSYAIVLGSTAGPAPAGGPVQVFDLPAGVTVNSAQAGIVDNLWTPPAGLHLTANDSALASGETLKLTTWNGAPAQPAALYLTSVNASPVLLFLGAALLDGNGVWSLGPIPHDPALAGLALGFRSGALDGLGGFAVADEVVVSVL